MIITEDGHKYAVELGVAEEALNCGMEEKSKDFVVQGTEKL